MLSLNGDELLIIKDILAKNVPDCKVLAFGSRITGKAKKYSDLDIVVVGSERVERSRMAELKKAFQTSKIPFRVEVLDWHRIPGHFKKIIESRQEVIQLGRPLKKVS